MARYTEQWWNELIHPEPARRFGPGVPVISEMRARAAVLKAMTDTSTPKRDKEAEETLVREVSNAIQCVSDRSEDDAEMADLARRIIALVRGG